MENKKEPSYAAKQLTILIQCARHRFHYIQNRKIYFRVGESGRLDGDLEIEIRKPNQLRGLHVRGRKYFGWDNHEKAEEFYKVFKKVNEKHLVESDLPKRYLLDYDGEILGELTGPRSRTKLNKLENVK